MEFTEIHGDLGAPVQDVAQEAVDATATRYARTPDIAGHAVQLGRHDGSVG